MALLDLNTLKDRSLQELVEVLGKSLVDEHGNITPDIDNLLLEVEEAIVKCKAEINTITENMVSELPKMIREVDLTAKEVKKLEEDIERGLTEAQNVQRKTTTSMTTLKKLDVMKSKVLATSTALQEADKWTSLAKQIEQLLDAGDVHKSYECILGMEKSLSVLNPAIAEERRLILEDYKNQLEALATKHLVLAFDSTSTENAKFFFTMFSDMNRVDQFIKYFQSSEKLKLAQEWRKFVETSSFKEATVKLYDLLVDHWQSKLPWCKAIFSNNSAIRPVDVLLDLHTDALAALDPSLVFVFETEIRKVPFMETLIQFNQVTERFASNVRNLIDSQGVAVESAKIERFLRICFTPFLTQYEKYAKHYELLIYGKVQQATVATAASSGNSNESVSLLQERIESSKRLLMEIILHIKEGEEKVKIFNRGFGYLHFGKGLSRGLERFASWNQDIYKFMLKTIDNASSESMARNPLENVLAFTEVCGDMLKQLTRLDQNLSGNCARVFGNVKKQNTTPWEDCWNYYLDGSLRVEILQFVQKKETLLGKAIGHIKKLCQDATKLVLRVTSEPIRNKWSTEFHIADSSLKDPIPSEYITHMGEYIMLLPQNLEPFIISDNSSISYAFEQSSEEVARSPIDFILASLASSICDTFQEKVLKLTSLTEGQARQLAQDIGYLGSVLEDLSLKLTSELIEIMKILRNFQSLNEVGISEKLSLTNQRLFNSFKAMKNARSK